MIWELEQFSKGCKNRVLFWLLFTRNYKKLLVVTIDVLLCMKIRYACYLDVIFTAGIGSEYWVAITTLFGVCALIY